LDAKQNPKAFCEQLNYYVTNGCQSPHQLGLVPRPPLLGASISGIHNTTQWLLTKFTCFFLCWGFTL